MIDLRRLRLLLTALYALVALVTVTVLVGIVVHYGITRIDERMQATVEREFTDVLAQRARDGQPLKDSPTWYVNTNESGSSQAFSETDVEPPLFRLMADAGSSRHFETFSQGGRTFLAGVFPFTDKEGYVTVLDVGPWNAQKRSLRRRVSLLGAALVALATIGGWIVAGRSFKPARQAVEDQRAFLADAAHEMRTPMAVIQASASQALSRPRSSEEYVRSLAEIRAASERASAGVNELLDLVRFDTGQAIPRVAPLRLDLLAEELAASIRVDDCEVQARAGAPVVVDADMALLRQAVDNIVRNAARRAAHVELVTTIEGRDGVIEVADDGPGFDETVLAHVFDRYRRGDTRGNAGLGLAIVKAIASAHGGAVEAANRPEGGAVVRLRVPLTR